jgi:predicted ATPase/class 3 adenylate cyclase
MSSYPSGTVTFLFTDIEGSTKLAQEYTDRWETLRARHHAIMQSACDTNHGFVFQIIGDAFCVAFHTAADGLSAAVESQRGLQREDWGEAIVKVRMGLHTGSAELHGNDYRGYLTMAKVQRIMAVAYGGQVVLSNASAQLIHNELPRGISLRDLKEHRLKSLPDPERLWQVVAPELEQQFPPLQSLMDIPNNLPVQLTSFIGREKEIDQVKKRLAKHRLVTLTGSGGVGKTRLSIQVAAELLDQYPNGVWLVELAPITDPSLVAHTACTALDVTPQGNVSVLSVLINYLKKKKLLIVVDNCEHLIDACAQLCASLLHACPDLRMIASSREALSVEGESAYRVPSLSLPHPNGGLQTVEESEAVRLFMQRARAVLPEFELTEINALFLTQICQRLDGIALAIELAASRVKLLKVEQIASRLDDAFRLLTGGNRSALPRHQTLRALIDWSYNLLSEEEQTVLRQFSVFIGGWTLEAAEVVCGNTDILELLTHLVDKSLVTVDLEHGDEPRYYLLETIRQYAREKLIESGEINQIHARHFEYFLELAQKAEPELYGHRQVEWLENLETEQENLHAALEWSLKADIHAGRQLTGSIWWYWDISGHISEGYKWLMLMLASDSDDHNSTYAKLLAEAGWFAGLLGFPEKKKEFAEKSVALYQELGDRVGIAIPLITLGAVATQNSDYGRATQLLNESLDSFELAQNEWGIGFVQSMLGTTAEVPGNFEQAQIHFQKSLEIFRSIGDKEGIAWALYLLGGLANRQENYARAIEYFEEALNFVRVVKTKPTMSWILNSLGGLLIYSGNYERGGLLLEEAMELQRKMGNQVPLSFTLQTIGWGARIQEDYSKAQRFYSESLLLSQQISDKGSTAECLVHIGLLVATLGSLEKFVLLLGMAEGIAPNVQSELYSFHRTETEKYITNARAVLAEETYTAAYEAGQKRSLDKAISYALKEMEQ